MLIICALFAACGRYTQKQVYYSISYIIGRYLPFASG